MFSISCAVLAIIFSDTREHLRIMVYTADEWICLSASAALWRIELERILSHSKREVCGMMA